MAYGRVPQRISPTLYAGRLRHMIDLVLQSEVQDTTGGTVPTQAVVYADVYASVEDVSGDSKWAADSYVSTVSHEVIIRYIGAAPSWLALENYTNAFVILDGNGNLQQAQGAGLSGATEPTWGTHVGDLTSDGDPSTGITWKCLGPSLDYTG